MLEVAWSITGYDQHFSFEILEALLMQSRSDLIMALLFIANTAHSDSTIALSWVSNILRDHFLAA